jgi:hypothetical protein
MERLGLVTVADDRRTLDAALDAHAGTDEHVPPGWVRGAEPAAAVLEMRPRVRPWSRARIVTANAFVTALCAILALGWLSTDDAYNVAAASLRIKPTTRVEPAGREAALVVRVPASSAQRLAEKLSARGIHASFAIATPISPSLRHALATAGDDALPELARASRVKWVKTRAQLRGLKRSGDDRHYLAPVGGMSLAQYLMARSADASPVAGQLRFKAAQGGVEPAPSVGDIVVVTAGSSVDATVSGIARFSASARRSGVRLVPLAPLMSSAATMERTARDDVRTTAPPVTAIRPAARPKSPVSP